MSCSEYGVAGSVAVNQFIASAETSDGNGCVSLTMSLLPLTVRPLIFWALPS